MIDIVICTYNRSALLEKAINSVLGQKDPNFALYILDNCSGPETEKLCNELLPTNAKFLRHKQNLGMVGNWNFALGVGKSKYFMILHDDDELEPNFVSEANSFLEKNKTVSFVHSAASLIDGDGIVTGMHNPNYPTLMSGTDYFKRWSERDMLPVCPSAIYNRSSLIENGGFSSKFPYTADIMCFISLARFGSVGYISAPIIKYRRHEQSTSVDFVSNMDKKIGDRLEAQEFIDNVSTSFCLAGNGKSSYGTDYVNFALISDLLFVKFAGGHLNDVVTYLVKIIKVRPKTILQKRVIKILFFCLFPVGVLRSLTRRKKYFLEKIQSKKDSK